MMNSFMPKQAVQFDGALLQELQGDVSDTIIRDLLANNLPPISPSSTIHDNGCGYGAVTMAVMKSDPKPPHHGVQIHATDVNMMFVAQLQTTLKENPSWPVHAQQMDACKLLFDDETFDLSLTTFVFAGLEDDVSAARHIMRTLKPGGTAAIAVWKDMPWHIALENAHRLTRGANEPMAPFLSKSWYKKEKLDEVTRIAGWRDVSFVQRAAWLNLGPDLKRWVTIAWTFLGTPVGGWQQRDEDNWDEAVNTMVEEIRQGDSYKFDNGVHKVRMVADVAIMQK